VVVEGNEVDGFSDVGARKVEKATIADGIEFTGRDTNLKI